MRVYIGRNGVSAHSVNDKAKISHEIEQKTALSKRSDGVISNRNVRSAGGDYTGIKPTDMPRGSPSAAVRKKEHFDKKDAHSVGTHKQEQSAENVSQLAPEQHNSNTIIGGKSSATDMESHGGAPSIVLQKQKHFVKNGSQSAPERQNSNPIVGGKSSVTDMESHGGAPSIALQKQEHFAKNGSQSAPEHKAENSDKPHANKPFGYPKRKVEKRVNSPALAPRKKYKVLKNGVVGKDALTKKKDRVIYGKKAAKLQKIKLKKLRKQQIKLNREQAQLTGIAMGGFAKSPKSKIPKAVVGAKKVVNLAKKPVDSLKQQFYSQADKSDDNGVKAAKLGVQITEHGVSGAKTAVNMGVKTAKTGSKITKRVYRKIHKPTSAELRRKLRKRVNHNLTAEAKFLAKRAIKNGSKAAGKAVGKAAAKTAAKASAKAAQQIARATAKLVQAAARAVTGAVSKLVGLIAETMPYSLIIIAIILLIVLIAFMFASMIGGAGGSVAGGGAWLVDDNSSQTPEEIYEGYKEFVEQAKEVLETQAKEALEDEVTGFCDSDTEMPYKIIQYIDKENNLTFYPSKGADERINAIIEQFGKKDYADFMSVLFVLMTREKQQADGVSDGEIYDFDFKKEDFEEFIKTVNENSCRWGATFIIKTAEETEGNTCPGERCRREIISGCKCASYVDDSGRVHEYCGGHCPDDHTKLIVRLYTVKDYYEMDYPEIYNFTENEKTRYEASRAIIQGMLDYWEGGNNKKTVCLHYGKKR